MLRMTSKFVYILSLFANSQICRILNVHLLNSLEIFLRKHSIIKFPISHLRTARSSSILQFVLYFTKRKIQQIQDIYPGNVYINNCFVISGAYSVWYYLPATEQSNRPKICIVDIFTVASVLPTPVTSTAIVFVLLWRF